LVAVKVHSADIQDRDGAKLVVAHVPLEEFPRLVKVWADGGHRGKLEEWVAEQTGWDLEIVSKPKEPGFHVLARRWVVERTFAWLGRFRRLSKDYERLCESEEL
jgi:putative transposase